MSATEWRANANGAVTRYAYDLLDRLVTTTDAVGRVTRLTYDVLSRPTQTSNTAIQPGPLLSQTYTADGLRASLTDARGNTTAFAYDGFNRLATTTYPITGGVARTETLTYDSDSNVTFRCTRAGKPVGFTYDTLNRLSTRTQPGSAANCAATPVGTVVTYAYDLAGRMTGVSDNSSSINPVATPATTTSYTAAYAYDALNRLTGVTFGDVATAATPAAPQTVEFGHSYNAVNQRIGQTASDNSWIEYPPASASTTAYTANALNQYTAVGAVTPSYDSNANLISDGTLTLGYDGENRLVSASGGGNTASYTYDGRSRRKTRTVNGTTTVSITDADNREVLEYNEANGAILRWFVYGLGPNDVLAQIEAGGTRYTPVPDLPGSIIAVMNASTGVMTKYGYGPYGSSASPPSPFAFTGQRIDVETGLYYYRARQYSTGFGRFLQADPIGYRDGPGLYTYVGNDPLNLIDPFGLSADRSSDPIASRNSLISSNTAAQSFDTSVLPNEIGSLPTIAFANSAADQSSDQSAVVLASDITGFRKHGINQTINRGISPGAILDAVRNPIAVQIQSNGTIRYFGAGAVVVLNPAGQVVTVWGQ